MGSLLCRLNAVAVWRWVANDDSCGICRMQFDACCPECKLPGDDCPLGQFLLVDLSTVVIPLVEMNLSLMRLVFAVESIMHVHNTAEIQHCKQWLVVICYLENIKP